MITGFSHILLHFALMALSAYATWSYAPALPMPLQLLLYYLCSLFIGTRMRALGNIVHECAHFAFVPSKYGNILIGKLLCAIEFSNFEVYQRSHFLHHRHLGNPQKDGDMQSYLKIAAHLPLSQPKKWRRYFVCLCTFNPVNLVYMFKKSFSPLSQKMWFNVFQILYMGMLLFLVFYFGIEFFFIFYIFPLLFTYQQIKIFSDLCDHDMVYFNKDIQNRTCNHIFRIPFLNWFFFPRNDAYHLVHHLYPSLPTRYFKAKHHYLLKKDKVYAQKNHFI